ncbi:complement C1q and tumor necrosis factor-related protein 9A-like [Hylobates moloch]|uniref:complement C1q and tumor necrosis factor-related protein 9A-like n=1 Tax=Hylobates moloch TaxID=81572 RepID=UPI002676B005|nr:complement C1q and tumor necrosis factor-related protein 9A-like [Hylobates moloch]
MGSACPVEARDWPSLAGSAAEVEAGRLPSWACPGAPLGRRRGRRGRAGRRDRCPQREVGNPSGPPAVQGSEARRRGREGALPELLRAPAALGLRGSLPLATKRWGRLLGAREKPGAAHFTRTNWILPPAWNLGIVLSPALTGKLRHGAISGSGLQPSGPGEPGRPGSPGKDGTSGEKGERGADGKVEAKGIKGDQGSRGSPGKHGPKGLAGPMGEKGLRGETGPQGQKGNNGDVGPTGPEGPRGNIGPLGPTGLPGPMGPIGKPGPKGEAGPMGPQGEPGVWGIRGWKGDRGEKGKIGETLVLPKSAFTVGLTVLSKFPSSDVPIKFDKILYNEFNHYDIATGKFTCHVAGVYYFTYHITVFSRNVQVSLVKNGVKILHTKDAYTSSEDQASGGIVLQLKLGDEVWLQVTGGERFNGLFADEDDDTTFTGFLLFSSP